MGTLAELAVVVAGAGDPHVEHGDGVVIVAQPAVAGDGIIAGLSGVEEGVPLLVLQVHVDAYGRQGALQVFADRLVGFAGVVEVSQGREVLDRLGGLVELIVFFEDFDGSRVVALQSIRGDIIVSGIAVVMTGIGTEVSHAVRFCQSAGDEGGSGGLAALGDLIDDVIAVKKEGDGSADLRAGLLGFPAFQAGILGKDVLIDVPADIVGTQLAGDDKLIRILFLEGGDLIGRHFIDQLPVAVLKVCEHVVGVVRQIEIDGRHGDFVRFMVVLIFDKGDDAVVLPCSHDIGAVADIGGGICRPAFIGYDILADRHVGGESHKLVPVRDLLLCSDFQSPVVDCLDSQQLRIGIHIFHDGISLFVLLAGFLFLGHFVIAGDLVEHVPIIGSCRGVCRSLPGKLKVPCSDRLSVGPLEAVAQRIGIGDSAVFVLLAFYQLFRAVRSDLKRAVLLLLPLGQTGKGMKDQGSAVD